MDTHVGLEHEARETADACLIFDEATGMRDCVGLLWRLLFEDTLRRRDAVSRFFTDLCKRGDGFVSKAKETRLLGRTILNGVISLVMFLLVVLTQELPWRTPLSPSWCAILLMRLVSTFSD